MNELRILLSHGQFAMPCNPRVQLWLRQDEEYSPLWTSAIHKQTAFPQFKEQSDLKVEFKEGTLGVDMQMHPDQDDGVRSRALRINSKKEPVNLEDLEAKFQQNHRAAQMLFLMEIDLRRQWDVYTDTLSTLAQDEAKYIEEQYWEQVELSWERLTLKWARKGKAVPARAQPRPPAGVGGVKILQNRMSVLGGIPDDVGEKMRQKLDKLAEAFSSGIRQVDRDEFAALAKVAERFFVQDKGRAITLSLSGMHAHGRDSSGGAC